MKRTKMRLSLVLSLLLLALSSFNWVVEAQLSTSPIFTNGMVLQRGREIPVWGKAVAGDSVYVKLNGFTGKGKTGTDGRYLVKLPSMDAGGPYSLEITSGTTTLTRTDVYVGDVWFASGQSNMALKLSESTGGATEASLANNQLIRQFSVPNNMGAEPLSDITSGSWTPATSSYAGNFTALGYYFAKNLQPSINVPIGIINASKGGARIEAFMSELMLGFDEKTVKLANGEPERQPTMAFNTMINPLVNYAIKGFIWYQGESNADNLEDATAYSDLFKRMITSWRSLWGQGDVPFLWIQLPNEGTVAVESIPGTWDAWPRLRACQTRALALPNTAQVTTIDVGEVDIHPKNKKTVGERLALAARNTVYGENIVSKSPTYKSYVLQADGHVFIEFNNIGSGLVAKNSVNDTIHWFSMAGADGVLHSAKAVLKNNVVDVWCDNVSIPFTVRYAWEFNPVGVNLFNAESFPAEPFMFQIGKSFEISSFTATSNSIERGKSTVLSWETHGAVSTKLNTQAVDSVDGVRVWPTQTTTYDLEIVSNADASVIKKSSVTITVTDPMPTISIKSNLGELVSPDSTAVISATVVPPLGGTISKVDFYINDQLYQSVTQAPYEVSWKSTFLGEHKVSAIVTDGNNHTVTSNSLTILVAKLKLDKYEAEDAILGGKGTIKNSAATSGGKYYDLTDGWLLMFSTVSVPEDGDYYLSIRYLLNYGIPKTQNLIINGTLFEAVNFDAPNATTWMTYLVKVPLKAGNNTIEIDGVWDWMCFDYIAVAVKETSVGVEQNVNNKQQLLQAIPSSFKAYTDLTYTVNKSGKVSLVVYSSTGQQVATLVNENKLAGTYTTRFEASNLPNGVYVVKLQCNGSVETKKIIHNK